MADVLEHLENLKTRTYLQTLQSRELKTSHGKRNAGVSMLKKGQVEQHRVSELFCFRRNNERFGSASGYQQKPVSANSRVRHSSLNELGSSAFFGQQLANSTFLALRTRQFGIPRSANSRVQEISQKIPDRTRSSDGPRIMKQL